MKALKTLVMAVIAICLASCGGNGKLTPVSKNVNGPLGDYFEIVEREYALTEDGKLSIEFQRIAEGGPTDASWSTEPTFTAELQDADGNTIVSESTNVVFTEEQLEAVFSLKVGESSTITFNFGDKAKGAAKLKVSSKWDADKDDDSSETSYSYGYSSDDYESSDVDDDYESDYDSDDDDDDYSYSSDDDDEDWDALLNSYEQYVDKCIALARKAANGDLSALSEYSEMMEKANDFSSKLQNATGSMSASQMARFNKIMQKMANAASSI